MAKTIIIANSTANCLEDCLKKKILLDRARELASECFEVMEHSNFEDEEALFKYKDARSVVELLEEELSTISNVLLRMMINDKALIDI